MKNWNDGVEGMATLIFMEEIFQRNNNSTHCSVQVSVLDAIEEGTNLETDKPLQKTIFTYTIHIHIHLLECCKNFVQGNQTALTRRKARSKDDRKILQYFWKNSLEILSLSQYFFTNFICKGYREV